MTQKLIKNLNQIGGGILGFIKIRHCEILRSRIVAIHFMILVNLNATELSTLCTNPNSECKIDKPQSTITNHSHFTTGGSEGIYICTTIGTFTNYGDIVIGGGNQAFTLKVGANIGHFINYGKVGVSANGDKMSFWSGNQSDSGNVQGISRLTNYGTMGAIDCDKCKTPMTLNNLGTIGRFNGFNIKGKFMIENYALKVSENAETFNTSTSGLSHLVVSGSDVSFKDGNSKIILGFGSGFDFGTPYLMSKLVVNTSGQNVLNVDLSRLIPKSDIFHITQSGEHFIVNLAPQYGVVGSLYKANIRTMNNFLTMSNSMIYPRKFYKSQNLGRKISKNISSLRASEYERGNTPYENIVDSALDSAFSLKSYESFAYQNESQNPQTRRIQRQKRNYSRNVKDSSLRADSQNLRGNPKDLRAKRSNHPQNFTESKPYYFILTPFVNHNLFFESGRYNLSGFDYGFLTAFSARVAESNSFGAHFMMSYGSLGDSSDKNFHISNLNLNLGLNYKLDLIYDMFFKARGDVFYFLNTLDSATLKNIKPNNLGFGASVAYGKDFDFKQGGVLGLEAGLDYKALQSSTISLHNDTYQKQLYNLLYADLGLSYNKYFGNFGINANLGIKGNITANKLAKSQISLKNFNRSVDMILDNDKVLGYANVGLSYVLNARNFDMEFSLAYYGNFGDRVVSNGGGFEWRVGW